MRGYAGPSKRLEKQNAPASHPAGAFQNLKTVAPRHTRIGIST